MIDYFLRRPRGAGEVVADSVRVIGAVSILVAGIGWGAQYAVIFLLVLLGLLVPRSFAVRPSFDAFYGIALLVAAWSAALDLYTSVPGWDVLVHFVANGVTAAMSYVLLARLGAVPAPDAPRSPLILAIVLTVALGLAAGSLWEMAEWAGHTFVDPTIFVAYDDTIGDMAAGGLGALVGGCALRMLVPRTDAASRVSRP